MSIDQSIRVARVPSTYVGKMGTFPSVEGEVRPKAGAEYIVVKCFQAFLRP